MALSDIISPSAIIKAVEEFDELGRDNFLNLYGFGKAHSYYLKLNNNLYDSKAIVGVAHKYSSPNKPLKSEEFSGGENASVKLLRNLGFKVIKTDKPDETKSTFPIQAYSWIALSDKVFIKISDKSCFFHHGTGVPYIFRQYLDIEDIAQNTRIEAILNFNGKDYRAYFELTKSLRTRLMWSADFSEVLKNAFPTWAQSFMTDISKGGEPPKIKLVRRANANHTYDIQLIDKPLTMVEQELEEAEQPEWTDDENRIIVSDYFQMLEKEIRGDSYNKTEHRNSLMKQLNNRSKGAIEFKHQNISAVVSRMGLPYLQGYKPRFNIQSSLVKAVEEFLNDSMPFNRLLEQQAQKAPAPTEEMVFTEVMIEPPEVTAMPEAAISPVRSFSPRKTDYAKRESENRSLGMKGEEFVIAFERQRLINAGRRDLADQIRHVSKDDGDGAGYDILSFTEDGEKLFIEVKTTRTGKYSSFYMSAAERDFLEQHTERYRLYRVINFEKKKKLYFLTGFELLQRRFAVSQYTVLL